MLNWLNHAEYRKKNIELFLFLISTIHSRSLHPPLDAKASPTYPLTKSGLCMYSMYRLAKGVEITIQVKTNYCYSMADRRDYFPWTIFLPEQKVGQKRWMTSDSQSLLFISFKVNLRLHFHHFIFFSSFKRSHYSVKLIQVVPILIPFKNSHFIGELQTTTMSVTLYSLIICP